MPARVGEVDAAAELPSYTVHSYTVDPQQICPGSRLSARASGTDGDGSHPARAEPLDRDVVERTPLVAAQVVLDPAVAIESRDARSSSV